MPRHAGVQLLVVGVRRVLEAYAAGAHRLDRAVDFRRAQRHVLDASAPLIAQLLRVAEVRFEAAAPEGAIPFVVGGASFALPVAVTSSQE